MQVSLNHPSALVYDLQVTLGSEDNALVADFATNEAEMTISGSVPFVASGSAALPTQAGVMFTVDFETLFELDDPESDVTLGTVTVEGTEIAQLMLMVDARSDEDVNPEADIPFLGEVPSYMVYLQFSDGSYPADGGLFTTVEELINVECAVDVEGPCYGDQAGVVDLKTLIETFYQGMPVSNPYYQAPEPTPPAPPMPL